MSAFQIIQEWTEWREDHRGQKKKKKTMYERLYKKGQAREECKCKLETIKIGKKNKYEFKLIQKMEGMEEKILRAENEKIKINKINRRYERLYM